MKLPFSPRCLIDLAALVRDSRAMRTLAVIFVSALIAIAGEIQPELDQAAKHYDR